MARFLTLAAIAVIFNVIISTEANGTVGLSPLSDPKHRIELVDEAFLEQKDVLLEMLEAKLKEVRDNKKKRKSTEKSDHKSNSLDQKCDTLSKDKTLTMKANGISNVGVVNILMNHGVSGKGNLRLDADGISNVGRAHLELGMDGGVNVPGISDSLIVAPPRQNNIFCDNQESTKEAKINLNTHEGTPISLGELKMNEVSDRKTDVNDTNISTNNTNIDIGTPKIKTNGTTTEHNIDNDDIDVGKSNITATTINVNVTAVTATSTPSIAGNNVTAPSNLNTIAK